MWDIIRVMDHYVPPVDLVGHEWSAVSDAALMYWHANNYSHAAK